MEFTSVEDMKRVLAPALRWDGGVEVLRAADLRGPLTDRLVWTAVFAADPGLRDTARWLIREAATALGAWPASILDLYLARGRGECAGFTVPAFNIRGITYDTMRAVFRAARACQASAFLLELARSEIGYTFQRPGEYAAAVLGAALREGWEGPVFLQGDHYQVNAKKYHAEPASEISAIEGLIVEALAAGIYNIDIDTSTMVDLSRPTIPEQQELNCTLAARFTQHIWRNEPAGMRVSIGGEIGEVGAKNSTPEELNAFMEGYLRRAGPPPGDGHGRISKISVQTGTSHGGTPLADGSVAPVALDINVLRELSVLSRDRYGMAGAVQHGASTLPESAFDQFPKAETAEIHLATGFQNMILDHPKFPADLKREMLAWVARECARERKEGSTDEQFIYKSRKKVYGPFKRALWSVPEDVMAAFTKDLEAKFSFFFDTLGVAGTRDLVASKSARCALKIPPPDPKKGFPSAAPKESHAEKDLPVSDLAD